MSDDNYNRDGAKAARDAGMADADAGADPAWKAAANAAIVQAARENATFTADDVWPLIGSNYTTREPRAMGPRMREAIRDGVIEKVMVATNSIRRSRHAGHLTMWRSLIFKGGL